LKDILLKHDVDANERVRILQKEIADIKTRLANVESALADL
jgi:hypothetical protein